MRISRDPFTWLLMIRDAVAPAIAVATAILLWLRIRSARHWPMTYGKVEFGKCYQVDPGWVIDRFYSYKVGEDLFSGQIELRARDERHAEQPTLPWKNQRLAHSLLSKEVHDLRGTAEDRAFLLG